MSGAAPVRDATGIPPLGRDRRVHAWILSGAVSEAGDVAWYVGLAWSAAQVASPAGARLRACSAEVCTPAGTCATLHHQ